MTTSEEKFSRWAFWGILGLALFAFCFDLGNREPQGYEYRHAVINKLMLKEGFSWFPTLFDVPYAQKPPLFLWASYGAVKLLGGTATPFAIALPSALSAVLITMLLFSFLRRFDLRWAVYSCLILVTTYAFHLKARQSTIDVMLALWVTLTLVGFYSLYAWNKKGGAVLAILGLGLGWLTKGPLGVCLPSAVILAFLAAKREWRKFFSYGLGLGLIAVGLFVAWYGLCYWMLGKEYVRYALRSQTYSRFLSESRKPVLFYVFVVVVFALPWCYPCLRMLWLGIRKKVSAFVATPLRDCWLLSLSWFGVTFLIFTVAADKHWRYFMPALPPMAILAASYFVVPGMDERGMRWFWKGIRWLVWGLFLLLVVGNAAWFFVPAEAIPNHLPRRLFIAGAGFLIFALLEFQRRRNRRAFGWPSLIAGLLGILLFLTQLVEPAIATLKAPKEMVLRFEQIARRQNPIGFYHVRRDDVFKYMYFSFRMVYPMFLKKADEIPETMRFMKYKRGLIVTYRKHFNRFPAEIQKDCQILLSEKFRGREWVLIEWTDPL